MGGHLTFNYFVYLQSGCLSNYVIISDHQDVSVNCIYLEPRKSCGVEILAFPLSNTNNYHLPINRQVNRMAIIINFAASVLVPQDLIKQSLN